MGMNVLWLFFLMTLMNKISYGMVADGIESKAEVTEITAVTIPGIDISREVTIEFLRIKAGDAAGKARIMRDLEQIQKLQQTSYGTKSEDEAKVVDEGVFKEVSPLDQLVKIVTFVGIFVARYQGRVIGYLLPLSKELACMIGGETKRPFCDAFDKLAGTAIYCQLAQVCVAMEHRNKGYARRLLQAFFKVYAVPAGCHVVFVMIPRNNHVAYKFFDRMGLKKLDTGIFGIPKLSYDIYVMDLRVLPVS